MRKAEAQKELARWTLVSLDVDAAPDDARSLAVGAIPALRILTPAGKAVATQEGSLPAKELVAWLEENFAGASSAGATELADSGELTVVAAVKLVREFRRRDPTSREAAIRRLEPHPQLAAPLVTSAFEEGSLSTRLAAMELFSAWQAPIDGMDPWRPETITEERLKALATWATALDDKASSALARPRELTPGDRRDAADSLQRLLAVSPTEAVALREQLARHGAALLPLVYEQLRAADNDQNRERLTALRYRLVATDALVLGWPGGLERLAAPDPTIRHQAVDELSRRATTADEPLLLELFSDPEPLVRELSLRALHQTGSEKGDSALVRLLQDPEPNVRAAVLKQLAESSPRAVISKIAKYIENEKDPDLIVQAIRVLREVPSKTSTTSLMSLLKHDSWRVRAEAAEALGKMVGGGTRTAASTEDQAGIYVALVDLLRDEDPFVMSRAISVLGSANLVTAVDPLAEAAQRQPDLAVEVVEALAQTTAHPARVEVHLRKFTNDKNPKVRAAAIGGLCSIHAGDLQTELGAALADAEASVRTAAGTSLFELILQRQKQSGEPEQDLLVEPRSGLSTPTQPDLGGASGENASLKEGQESAPRESEVEDFVATLRKGFPKWTSELRVPLQKLLTAELAEERLAGALPLAAMGEEQRVFPTLIAAARDNPQLTEKISTALFWLDWDRRKSLFAELTSGGRHDEQLATVASAMAERRDLRAAGPIWDLLARPAVSGKLADGVHGALGRLYLGSRWYYELEKVPRAQKNLAISEARKRATAGPRWQRLVALSFLLSLAPEEAATIARQIQTSDKEEATAQLDALRVLLVSGQGEKESVADALAAFASSRLDFRALALRFLAQGPTAISAVEQDSFQLDQYRPNRFDPFDRGESAIPALPDDLKPELLTPFLSSSDPLEAAYAGYLLCLLEHPEGLVPLADYWRKQKRGDQSIKKLVYTAAAALGDADHVPLLAEVYESFPKGDSSDISDAADFYWTIRGMTGPEVLALRKRIRDEIGMDNLRSYAPSGMR